MWNKLMREERMHIMEEIQFRTATHRCPSCGDPTYCAMEAGKSANTCWCMTVPKDDNPDYYGETCLCKDCLTST